MSDGPDAAAVIVGLFLIVCGACIALVGGGCTVFFLVNIGEMFRYGGGVELPLMAVSVGALVAGIFMVKGGIRLMAPHD